jgi:hypothetical protein
MPTTPLPAAGPWRVTLDRLLAEADQAASQVTVTDGVLRAQAMTFSTACTPRSPRGVRDGLIVRQTEYWPDPFPAAACPTSSQRRVPPPREPGAQLIPGPRVQRVEPLHCLIGFQIRSIR